MNALARLNPIPFALLASVVVVSLLAQDIPLPAPGTSGGLPLMDSLAKRATAREFDARELSPRHLSGLLWACFGINRSDGKRTAPSTKNSQETDLYVILKQGAYVYDAKSNKLNLVLREDLRGLASTQSFATNAPVTLLFIVNLSKMEGGNTDENNAYANLDVGYISQNAYLFCASEGLVTGARASFNAKALREKLKLRPDQRIVLAQSVGDSPRGATSK